MDFSGLVPRAVDYAGSLDDVVHRIRWQNTASKPEPEEPLSQKEAAAALQQFVKDSTALIIEANELKSVIGAIQNTLEGNPQQPEPNPLDSELWDAWHLSRLRLEACPRFLEAQQDRLAEVITELKRALAWSRKPLRDCAPETRNRYLPAIAAAQDLCL